MADYKVIGKFHNFKLDPNTPHGIITQVQFNRSDLVRTAQNEKVPNHLAFQYITPRGKKLHSILMDLKEYSRRGKEVEVYLMEGKDGTLHITNIKELKIQ